MTDATTSTLSVRIETGNAARDLLALQKGLEGAATGVKALGREIQNHSGNIQTVLRELSKYSFSGLGKSLDDETSKLKSSMDKLEEQVGKGGREAGRKYSSNFSVALADGTKASFKAVGDNLTNLTSKVSAEGANMLAQFKSAGVQTAAALKQAGAEEKSLHAQRGQELLMQYRKQTAEEVALHAQRGQELLMQYRKQTAEEKSLHAQRGQELLMQYRKQTAEEKALHAQQGQELLMQYRQSEEDKQHWYRLRHRIAVAELKERLNEEKAILKKHLAEEAALRAKPTSLGGYPVANVSFPSVGAITSAAAELEKQRAAATRLTPALAESGTAMKKWSDDARVFHDTARGAAAGVGYLWMTWGNIGAMAAGFTAVRGMTAAIKEMVEVEVLLTKASREAGVGFDDMRDRIMSMYTDGVMPMVHGPKEVAEQLKNLVYAGFEASEAFDILGVSLKFAEVGELDAAEAAQVLQQTIHAFGLSGEDAGRVADVLAKAAAASATDVGAMSAAMKQAVAVGALYNSSVEDTATSLAVLAKAGIEGSSAGTSLKRFMDELASPKTNKAKEAIAELGVEVFKFEGGVRKLKGLGDIVDEMRSKFQQLSQTDAKAFYDLVDRMQDERGKKFFSLAVKMTQSEWDAFKTTIEKDSAGFVNSMYNSLAQTTAGLFKQTGAQLRASLQEALQGVDGAAKKLGESLLQAVSSQEFKSFLKGSLTLLAKLTEAIVNHASELAKLLGAYIAFKTASVALYVVATAYVRLSSAVAAAKAGQLLLAGSFLKGVTDANRAAAATAGVAVAANRATTAVGALALAMRANPLFALLSVVAAVAVAYLALRDNTNGAAEAARKAQAESENTIKNLKSETEETWKLVRAKERELGLRQSEREEGKATTMAKRGGLEAEIAALEKDPQAQSGRVILGELAAGSRGKLPAHLLHGQEISKAKRLEAAKDELHQIRKWQFEQEIADAALNRVNRLGAQKTSDGTPQTTSIPDLDKTGGAKALTGTESALKSLTDSLRRYSEEQEYSIDTGVKMTAGMKLLVKAYDMLNATSVGTDKNARALNETEKAALRQSIAIVEQNELRLAQEENRRIHQEAEKAALADQVQHEQNLLNVRVQSGEITKSAAATLSDLYTARVRDKAILAEQALIEEAMGEHKKALASGNLAYAQTIQNEADKRQVNIDAMRREEKQLNEINKVRANADWNKWNKEHGESVRKVNESVAAFMREKGAILNLTQATRADIKATEYAIAVGEKYTNEILKVKNELLEEELTWKTLLAQLDTTADEAERKRLIADIETSLKKWGALDDQMKALKVSQDGAAASAAALGREVAAAEDWQAAYQNISKSLEDSVIDGIYNGFNGGKDLLKNFKNVLMQEFDRMVLRPLIQPITSGISGGIMGMLGMGGSGSAAASGGMLGSLGTSAAGSWLGSVGLGSLGTMASYGVASATGGALLGATQGGMLAAQTGAFGAFGASSTASALGGAAGASSGFMGALASIPGWGWALGALALLAGSGLFGGKPSNKAAWGSFDFGTNETYGLGNMTGDKQASQETMDARSAMLTSVTGFDAILDSLGGTTAYQSVELGLGERDGVGVKFDGGEQQYYGDDVNAAMVRLFRELTSSSTGLSDTLKTLLVNFDGTAEEMILFGGALAALQEYADADPLTAAAEAAEAAGRSAWQVWQTSGTDLHTALAAWDGNLQSAQELATAVQSQYQMELQLIGQIQQALAATNAMFSNSIEQVQLSVLTEAEKYDFYRTKADDAWVQLQAATDPAEIQKWSTILNDSTMAAWNLLTPEQKTAKSGEFTDYLEEADTLTDSRFDEATDLITTSHTDLATTIKDVMLDVAAAMKTAAETPQQVQVTVDVSVDTPADVEVGYMPG